jgi:hypothetical protein
MIKMKKSDLFIAYAVIVIGLSSLLGVIVSCQNGMTSDIESLAMPLTLPNARVEDPSAGAANARFTLAWKMDDGILSPSAVWDEARITEALKEVGNTYQRYLNLIDPVPHEPPDDSDSSLLNYHVWKGGRLNNGKFTIVINRYWPQSLIESLAGRTPTREDWLSSTDARAAAFKQAVKDIKAMMAAIKKSPLYEFEVEGRGTVLKLMYEHMERLIAFPSDPNYEYKNRTGWEGADFAAMDSGQVDTTQSSFLFEYFFGYVPTPTDYDITSGPFFFP